MVRNRKTGVPPKVGKVRGTGCGADGGRYPVSFRQGLWGNEEGGGNENRTKIRKEGRGCSRRLLIKEAAFRVRVSLWHEEGASTCCMIGGDGKKVQRGNCMGRQSGGRGTGGRSVENVGRGGDERIGPRWVCVWGVKPSARDR